MESVMAKRLKRQAVPSEMLSKEFPAFLMDSSGSGRQCSGKIERRGRFWSIFTHYFTFLIGERVSF